MSNANIFENAVAICVEFHQPGNTRKVDASNVEVDCDREMLTVSKRLLDSDEFRAIKHVDRCVTSLLKSKALPSFFKTGVFLLPVKLVEAVEGKLESYKAERGEAIAKFIEAYPALVESAKERLKGLYDPTEYPPAHEVAKAFSFRWSYVDFGVPGKLSKISATLYAKEQEKAEKTWAEATTKIQDALRVAFGELVRDMTAKLEPGADGKRKVIQERTMTKVREFLADFQNRNITGDETLAGMVAQAEALLEGKTLEQIRTDEIYRGTLAQGLKSIGEELGRHVTIAPKRVFKAAKGAAQADQDVEPAPEASPADIPAAEPVGAA